MFSEKTRNSMLIIIPPPFSTLLGFLFLADHSHFSPVKSAKETLGPSATGSSTLVGPSVQQSLCPLLRRMLGLAPVPGAGQQRARLPCLVKYELDMGSVQLLRKKMHRVSVQLWLGATDAAE